VPKRADEASPSTATSSGSASADAPSASSTAFAPSPAVVRLEDASVSQQSGDIESGAQQPCLRNCGFFGAPWTSGLCSKCYKHRHTVSLVLLSAPIQGQGGEAPQLLWSQRAGSVRLTIHVPDACSQVEAGLNDASTLTVHVTLQTGQRYELTSLSLFGACAPSGSALSVSERAVHVVLVKLHPAWWDKLTADKSYRRLICADQGRWCEEEDYEYFEKDEVLEFVLGADAAKDEVEDEDEGDGDDDRHPRFQMWRQVM
jgi:hypothetical protein